jgi:S1-C subfamily serine protease
LELVSTSMAFEKAWKWSAVRLLFVCLVLSELCSSFHNGPQRCAYEYTAAGAPCRRRTSGSTHRRHLCSPDNDVNAFWPDSTVVQQDDHEIEEDQEEDELTQVLDSILKVHCTHSEPDFLMPWQKMHQSTSTSSGFVVSSNGEKMIMTNAHSVEWASIIQVQRRGDERKYQAVIVTFANECDLALLKVVDSPVDFWEDLEPLEFGPLPSLQDEVEVLGFPTGGDSLSITQGVGESLYGCWFFMYELVCTCTETNVHWYSFLFLCCTDSIQN